MRSISERGTPMATPRMFETGPFRQVTDPNAGFDDLCGPFVAAVGDPRDMLPSEWARGRLDVLRQRAQDASR